ncbi:MAG: hypothetical protein JW760_13280 [Spirochaetales bacterium]|nr:hypothetical protein [Spirochaetales bacterium]
MNFRSRLLNKERFLGTLLTMDCTEAAEILSRSGFDWLFLDLEHSALGPPEAQKLLQAAGDRVPVLIRVESGDEEGIRKALDSGADGIIIPHVNSAKAAEHIVSLAKYPPGGTRSIGPGRASHFGNEMAGYLSQANTETAVVVQIEHIDAVAEVEKIASVEGIDALFVGPYDLSGSLGRPGKVDDPEVTRAIDRTLAAAAANHLAAGIFAGSAAAASAYLEKGFSLVAVASDGILLGGAAASLLEQLKN